MIFSVVFLILAKTDVKKVACIITFLVTGIQIADLYPLMKDKHSVYAEKTEYVSPLYSERWQDVLDGVTEIRFVTLYPNHEENYPQYLTLGVYASENDITMSSFYCARENYEDMSEYAESSLLELENGGGQENVLYVFFDSNRIPQNNDNLNIYNIDNIIVGRI
jgi:hypothetical protein